MLNKILFVYVCVILSSAVLCVRKYSPVRKAKLRDEVRGMFQHAYDGYLRHASDYDELRPLTCDGVNTWGSYSLTLIDALDTLAVMGNFSEFRHVADIIIKKVNFDNDINVSVFETNIRIVGGLLSAHLLTHKAGMDLEPGWPCNGPLLRLAEDVAKRLLPAFDTKTGMPYGTVNLKHGVPPGETPVTCTAGVGTFIVEFGALSRLTGDPIYEEVALNAIYSLWEHRSQIGLLGNHINVQTGRWTAQDAGIGAGVDSFFEYLVKGSIMLNRPDLLEMFHQARSKIDKYMKRDDWYVWVGMNKGQVTLPVFQSLEAYWPGVLSLINDIKPAMQTLHNYHTVWRQYGFLPELYNIPGTEAGANRESYPLRPELAESAMYLYRATKDPFLLEIGEDMLRSIEYSAKTSCGYSTIRNVRDHRKDNRMESFFLSETTKYLYLLFDDDNFLHNNGYKGTLLETPDGTCIIEAGGYIFNTEAHPIDPSALSCCYDLPKRDIFANFDISSFQGDLLRYNERQKHEEQVERSGKYSCPDPTIVAGSKKLDTNLSIDIEVLDSHESGIDLAKEMLDNFQKIQSEDLLREQRETTFRVKDVLASVNNVTLVDEMPTMLLAFMKNYTIPPNRINTVFQLNTSTISIDLTKCKTLWGLYVEYYRLLANNAVYEALGLQKFDKNQNETVSVINEILSLLNAFDTSVESKNNSKLLEIFLDAQRLYISDMTNVSKMLYFTILFAEDANESELQSTEIWKTKEKLNTLQEPEIPPVTNIDLELFEKIHEYAKFKKRMMDTLQKLQSLMEYNEKVVKTSTDPESHSEIQQREMRNDDIISISSKKQESPDEKQTNQNEAQTSQAGIENKHFKQYPGSQMEEPMNNSILTEFVQSFIKTAIPSKPKFDEQMFLKRIRSQMSYVNNTHNYETLTCDTPKFAERFTYRYDV